jgi:hypothetical protein
VALLRLINCSLINCQQLIYFSAGMSPAFAEAMGEAAALYKKPTYKIKNNLKYIDAYW